VVGAALGCPLTIVGDSVVGLSVDGAADGVALGISVGYIVGPDVGVIVGPEVGVLVGLFVGPEVGEIVGPEVGSPVVGVALGWSLAIVGESVVGLSVDGAADGLLLGISVG